MTVFIAITSDYQIFQQMQLVLIKNVI